MPSHPHSSDQRATRQACSRYATGSTSADGGQVENSRRRCRIAALSGTAPPSVQSPARPLSEQLKCQRSRGRNDARTGLWTPTGRRGPRPPGLGSETLFSALEHPFPGVWAAGQAVTATRRSPIRATLGTPCAALLASAAGVTIEEGAAPELERDQRPELEVERSCRRRAGAAGSRCRPARRCRDAGWCPTAAARAPGRRADRGTSGRAGPRSRACLRSRIGSRQHPLERALEDVLAGAAAQLQLGRHLGRQLDEDVVEQRHPRLDRVRHAHPIDLGQDVERQVALEIALLERREPVRSAVAAAARAQRLLARDRGVGASARQASGRKSFRRWSRLNSVPAST